MKNLFNRFVREESGQDIIEYVLLAAFISVVAWTIIQQIGVDVTQLYTNTQAVTGAAALRKQREGDRRTVLRPSACQVCPDGSSSLGQVEPKQRCLSTLNESVPVTRAGGGCSLASLATMAPRI
jgi:Flp pilus assembly pilin Flp